MHVFCNENTLNVIQNQIEHIHFSGLYDVVDVVGVFLKGEASHREACRVLVLESGKKFQVLADEDDDKTWERFTLLQIQKIVKPHDKFLYVHTKGITRSDNPTTFKRVWQWRNMMEWFLMSKAEFCLKALESHDCVGCNWRFVHDFMPTKKHEAKFADKGKGKHFSGNMFWCTGNFWLSLPDTIGNEYNDPEFHVGLANPKVKHLFESFVDHHTHNFPWSNFVDTAKLEFSFL